MWAKTEKENSNSIYPYIEQIVDQIYEHSKKKKGRDLNYK